MSIAPDSFQEFFRGLERAPLGFGELEFRWRKLTAKCLCENSLSDAVYSLSPLRKSCFNPVDQREQFLYPSDDFLLLGKRGQNKRQFPDSLTVQSLRTRATTAFSRCFVLKLKPTPQELRADKPVRNQYGRDVLVDRSFNLKDG
jgi:hypothetical protein